MSGRLALTGSFAAADETPIAVAGKQTWCYPGGVISEGGVTLRVGPVLSVEMTHYQARYLADLLTAAANVAGQV